MAAQVMLCAKEEVAPGEIIKVAKGNLQLAVYNVDGSFFVTDDTCTHGPGSLSEGYLDGHVIECDFHGGCFDIRDGSIVTPPCVIPLKTYAVVEDAFSVIIRVDEKAEGTG